MANIVVFVKYNGRWDQNYVYTDNEAMGVLVPDGTSYIGLLEILFEAFQLKPENHTIQIKYVFELGCSPVRILNDRDVNFYLELKKNEADKTKFPLCIDKIEEPMNLLLQKEHMPAIISRPPPDGIRSQDSESVDYQPEIGDGLKNQSQFHTPPVVEEEVNAGLNDVASNDVRSVDQGHSSSRADNGTDSIKERVANDGVTKRIRRSKRNLSPKVFDVLSEFSPTLIKVHGTYLNKRALQSHLAKFAISNHFQFKVRTSKRRTLHVVCRDNNCKWTVRATKMKDTDLFQIRRFVSEHTCPIDTRQGEHRQATSNIIGECVKHRYINPTSTSYRPKDIRDEMQRDYGVHMSYKKAWRSREKAMKALDEESYASLPSFSYMLERCNPGSVIALETDEHDQFLYYFMSLAAFIQGWPHCRPVIIVDRTLMKAYYRGTLLTACTIDANQEVFPLAFGVVDSENNNSWEWFFNKLKEAIVDRDELTIISDRHPDIINAVKKVYSNADHGYCMHYLLNNVKSNFKDVTSAVNWKFVNAAQAHTYEEWRNYMQMLDLEHNGINEYLAKDVGNEKWARCHFNSKRYSIMTSINDEFVNAIDVKIREYPIAKLLELLRENMQQWFNERREAAGGMYTVLAKKPEDRLTDICSNSTGMIVHPTSAYEFEVVDKDFRKFIVDLEARTCQCREFQLEQFVCAHAVAALGLRGLSIYSYVSRYYKKEELEATYAGIVHPLSSPSGWAIPDEIKSRVVKPPLVNRRIIDRPKRKRVSSTEEEPIRQKCSSCGQPGHNKQTCQHPISLRSPTSQSENCS